MNHPKKLRLTAYRASLGSARHHAIDAKNHVAGCLAWIADSGALLGDTTQSLTTILSLLAGAEQALAAEIGREPGEQELEEAKVAAEEQEDGA